LNLRILNRRWRGSPYSESVKYDDARRKRGSSEDHRELDGEGPSVSAPSGPFWIYRVFNDLGYLIYIGKTNNPRIRFEQHHADKAWCREAARWMIDMMESYATDTEVLAAEASAIRTERPLFNVEHNEGNPYRVNPKTMRYVTGSYRGALYRPELYADVRAGLWAPRMTVSRRRPAAPVYRRRRRAITRRRSGRPALGVWLVAWLLLAGLLTQALPGGSAFAGSAVLLALGRAIVRKMFYRPGG
jgi:predicted GIY-YIG superfamily endonuclease